MKREKWTPDMQVNRIFYYERTDSDTMKWQLTNEESYAFTIDARRVFSKAVEASTNSAHDVKIVWLAKDKKVASFSMPALDY